MKQSSYSPDLNPIENAWSKLKEQIYKIKPSIENFTEENEEARAVFTRAIKHAWEGLDQGYFNKLIKSMDNQVNEVLKADRWYTKY